MAKQYNGASPIAINPDRCPQCQAESPYKRYDHWLSFDSLDALRAHVEGWMQYEQCSADRKKERIEGVCMSYRETAERWRGLPDPDTGEVMHWRDARDMAFAHAAKQRAAREAAKAKVFAMARDARIAQLPPAEVPVVLTGTDDSEVPF